MGVIYREALFAAFGRGVLNAHIGLLPEYRGRSVMGGRSSPARPGSRCSSWTPASTPAATSCCGGRVTPRRRCPERQGVTVRARRQLYRGASAARRPWRRWTSTVAAGATSCPASSTVVDSILARVRAYASRRPGAAERSVAKPFEPPHPSR
jgi:hypothetical protein